MYKIKGKKIMKYLLCDYERKIRLFDSWEALIDYLNSPAYYYQGKEAQLSWEELGTSPAEIVGYEGDIKEDRVYPRKIREHGRYSEYYPHWQWSIGTSSGDLRDLDLIMEMGNK